MKKNKIIKSKYFQIEFKTDEHKKLKKEIDKISIDTDQSINDTIINLLKIAVNRH